MSFPGLLRGEGGCLAAEFPYGAILSSVQIFPLY